MNKTLQNKIEERSIDGNENLLACLKLMDLKKVKSLLVFVEGNFANIVSIGDIQRAILLDISLNEKVSKVLRPGATISNEAQDIESIKQLMFDKRMELMPIVNDQNKIIDLLIWEDIFLKEKRVSKADLNLPVVIMAGGKGTRLRPITNILPKPLIPLGDKTILERIMDSFVDVGCHDFHLSVNYKSELIKYYFDDLDHPDYKVSYFKEPKPLGTVGSITLLKGKINSTFFISNCDILINQDYSKVLEYHKEKSNEITIVAAIKHYKIPYGTLETGSEGQLVSLQEKPEINYKINSGLYILEPHLIDEIPEGEFFHITHLIEKILERKGKVGVFPISEGAWQDIGQWDQYLSRKDEY